MKFAGLDYDTFGGRSPFRLSGGQQRRVAIAGVIAMHPDFLILDEPSAGLDPIGRREIFSRIQSWYKKAYSPSSWYPITWTTLPGWLPVSWSCTRAIW